MQSGRNEPRDVREVDQQRRADLVGDLAKRLVLHDPRIRARAGDDELRLVLARQRAHLIEVDQLRILLHAVRDGVIELAGKTDLRAVRQMAAVRERHAQHRVAGLQHRHEDRHVRLRAGVRLHVGVFCAEDLLDALDRERSRRRRPTRIRRSSVCRDSPRHTCWSSRRPSLRERPCSHSFRMRLAPGSLFAGVLRRRSRRRARDPVLRRDFAPEYPP